MDAFYTQPICLGNAQRESLKSINAIIFNAPVTAISSGSDGNPIISYTDPSTGQIVSQSFPAVIVATSTRSMQMMRLTSSAVNDPGDVLDPSVKVAIRNMHHLDSSKMFIRTKTKFWKSDPTLPQNIQMDELPRGIYTLDYPQTETDKLTQIREEDSEPQDERLVRWFECRTIPSIRSAIREVHHSCG